MIRINKNPTVTDLRVFALVWLAFFTLLGVMAYVRTGTHGTALPFWAIAPVAPIVGWTSRPLLRLLYVGMCYAAFPIGWVVSMAALALLYFVVITPIGRVMLLFGHDPLGRKFLPQTDTYWIKRPRQQPVERYLRQF
ncbi:MAG: hypothetical protein JXO22_15915 [Phycisphaerae bacterium]|nr:hypothetical protein [Phycisphaerae bacterium]